MIINLQLWNQNKIHCPVQKAHLLELTPPCSHILIFIQQMPILVNVHWFATSTFFVCVLFDDKRFSITFFFSKNSQRCGLKKLVVASFTLWITSLLCFQTWTQRKQCFKRTFTNVVWFSPAAYMICIFSYFLGLLFL